MTGIEELIPITIGILGFIDDVFSGGGSTSGTGNGVATGIGKAVTWRAMTKLARDIYNRLTDRQKETLAKVMPLYGETEGRLTKEDLDYIYSILTIVLSKYNNLSNDEFLQRLSSSRSKKNRDKRQEEHDRLLGELALTREAILNAGINNIENLIRYYRGLTVERPPYVIPKIKEVLDPRYYDVLGELERHQPQTIEEAKIVYDITPTEISTPRTEPVHEVTEKPKLIPKSLTPGEHKFTSDNPIFQSKLRKNILTAFKEYQLKGRSLFIVDDYVEFIMKVFRDQQQEPYDYNLLIKTMADVIREISKGRPLYTRLVKSILKAAAKLTPGVDPDKLYEDFTKLLGV